MLQFDCQYHFLLLQLYVTHLVKMELVLRMILVAAVMDMWGTHVKRQVSHSHLCYPFKVCMCFEGAVFCLSLCSS